MLSSASSVDEWTPTQSHESAAKISTWIFKISIYTPSLSSTSIYARAHFLFIGCTNSESNRLPIEHWIFLQQRAKRTGWWHDLHIFSVIFDVIKQKQEENLLRVSGNPQTRSTLCASLSVVSQQQQQSRWLNSNTNLTFIPPLPPPTALSWISISLSTLQ